VGEEFRARPFGGNITLVLGAMVGAVAGFVSGAVVELIAAVRSDRDRKQN
jgi:hypothetical protein